MNISEFLIASNSVDSAVQYIVHTKNPKALIEIRDDGKKSEYADSKSYVYRPQNEVIPRRFTLSVVQIYELAANWNAVLDQAWDWHVKNIIE